MSLAPSRIKCFIHSALYFTTLAVSHIRQRQDLGLRMKNWKDFRGSGRGLNEILSSREEITIHGVPARNGTQHLPDTIQKRHCLDHQFSPFLSFTGLVDTGDNSNAKATYGHCCIVFRQNCYIKVLRNKSYTYFAMRILCNDTHRVIVVCRGTYCHVQAEPWQFNFMNVVEMSFHNISKDLRLQTRR
jgi:hypothetical protein